MQTFLDIVKMQMSKQGLKQKELAEITGLSTGTVSAMLAGKRGTPGPKTQARIAAALGYDLVDLLVLGKDGNKLSESLPIWWQELGPRVRELDKPQRLKLLSMIEGFLQAHDK